MRFDGKVLLVTGAGSGIGAAVARGFAGRGGAVVVVDLDAGHAEAVASQIAGAGGSAMAVAADLSERAGVEAMVDRAMARFGRIDVLHNNAFGMPPGLQKIRLARVAEIDDAVWAHTLQLGLTAVMQATRRVIPIMQGQGGGAIVNTASISGMYADQGIGAYNTMKAAVINLTRVTAVEYAGDNIRCNCICPGAIHTPMLENSLSLPGFADATVAAIPAGRLGRPDEMANVVLFLASDLASYVTGAALVADGGLTAQTGMPSRFRN